MTTTLERISDTELRITRAFRAPARIVFAAWTDPAHVARWFAPASRGVTVVSCTADVRPGGHYRYVLAHRGSQMAFAGDYHAVEAPTHLGYTQRFEPVLGHPVPGLAVIDVRFAEAEGVTTLISIERYPSKDVLEGVLATGMEHGMRESMDQLDGVIAQLT